MGVLVVSFLISMIVLAWTEPTSGPPGGNVDAPINVGTDPQTKQGDLTVKTTIYSDDLRLGNWGGAITNAGDIDVKDNTGTVTLFHLDGSTGNLDVKGVIKRDGNTVWDVGNDGSGSGLDADNLDGRGGNYYRAWGNITGMPAGFADGIDDVSGGGGYSTCAEIETDCNYVNEAGDWIWGPLTIDNNLTVTGDCIGCSKYERCMDIELECNYVNETGDVMSGQLSINNNLDVNGDIFGHTGHISGNLVVDGKITASGGIDPPYISFSAESHKSIREYAKEVEPHEKVMQFWNGKFHRIEIYVISEDKFYTITGESVEE